MKKIWMFFLLAFLLAFKSYAAEETDKLKPGAILFDGVQEHCVEVGEIAFGPGKPWNSCHIARARWISTIDLIDMYQTQYCLGKDEQSCEQRAWVIFANRAYTKEAEALVVRMDSPTTVYKDPQVIVTGKNYLMSMTSFNEDGVQTTHYFKWDMGHWMPLDEKVLLPNLAAKLPKGTSVRQPIWPDLESMTAKISLYKTSDKDCCPTGGKAIVDLEFAKENFSIKNINVTSEIQ